MKTPCFTLNYAAPEVLKQALPKSANNYNDSGYDASCDVSYYAIDFCMILILYLFISISYGVLVLFYSQCFLDVFLSNLTVVKLVLQQ